MKKLKREILIVVCLLGFSAAVYYIQYLLFRNPHSEAYYFFQDLAFLGVNSLIVYLLIDRLLSSRAKEDMIKRQNLLAGLFFYDTGVKIFNLFNKLLAGSEQVAQTICVKEDWPSQQFQKQKMQINKLSLNFKYDYIKIQELKILMHNSREQLVKLMENPGLHEHETFSDMLMALFHLNEELNRRNDLQHNDEADKQHILNDIRRAYVFLAQLWLEYMKHLKIHYPYLYLYNIKNRQFEFQPK